MHYRVRVGGRFGHKSLYNILGIIPFRNERSTGYVYPSGSEGADFWPQVLIDLHDRGLKDILVACTDNLKSFTAAIPSVYPKAEVQSCIVHQVRNPLKYVTGKHQKRVNEGFKTGLPCRYSLQIGTRKIRFNDLKFIGQPIFKPLLFP